MASVGYWHDDQIDATIRATLDQLPRLYRESDPAIFAALTAQLAELAAERHARSIKP